MHPAYAPTCSRTPAHRKRTRPPSTKTSSTGEARQAGAAGCHPEKGPGTVYVAPPLRASPGSRRTPTDALWGQRGPQGGRAPDLPYPRSAHDPRGQRSAATGDPRAPTTDIPPLKLDCGPLRPPKSDQSPSARTPRAAQGVCLRPAPGAGAPRPRGGARVPGPPWRPAAGPLRACAAALLEASGGGGALTSRCCGRRGCAG